MVNIDGIMFSVNSPAITTRMKSRFLFDRYEQPEREAIRRFLSPDLPIIEFGGSVGVVACLANKRLRDPQQHVVIEANPDLLPLLEENRDCNDCHFTVLHRAVAYGSDEIIFHQNNDFWASSVQAVTSRTVKVPTISLQQVIDQFGFDLCTLICDIEGGEIDLVQHEAETLRRRVAMLVIEVHPWCIREDVIDDMLHTLERIEFTPVYKIENNYVLCNKSLQHCSNAKSRI